jgi:pilus retraction protein PilT
MSETLTPEQLEKFREWLLSDAGHEAHLTTTLNELSYDLLNLPNVSDLFLTSDEFVWYKNNGVVQSFGKTRTLQQQEITILMSYLAPELTDIDNAIKEKEAERELNDKRTGLDFGCELNGIRLRGNISKANLGVYSLVLRKLNSVIPRFEDTTLPASVLIQATQPTGLILVTGATGSGKSTTLASILDAINEIGGKHIITIEDPIEYEIKSKNCLITKKCIGKDGPSFAAVLRAAMRQAPDVIMVGEIRDAETMRIAFEAAETGHIVLATMHTNSAVKTVDRVTSFFQAEEKDWAANILASNLRACISQILVPRKGGQGRALAYELMINTPDVASTIRARKVSEIKNMLDSGSSKGQMLMNRMLTEMIKKGEVTPESALKKAYDADGLRSLLKTNNITFAE